MKLRIFGIITVFTLLALNIMTVPLSMAGDVDVPVTATINSNFTETATSDLDFGTIELNPAGDVITITSTAGTAAPTAASGSVLTGPGSSGAITITHSMVITVWADYLTAGDVTLTNGTGGVITMSAARIAALSQAPDLAAAITSADATTNVVIFIGGELTIPGTQPTGVYTGTVTVTLNYS